MRERLVVQEEAASVISRPRMQGLMVLLIDHDCTMAELVIRCSMSYSLLSHHLSRLVALGLVRVVGQVPRAGRASVLYRASARSFFIPAVWCKALPGEQLARELREALQATRSPRGMLLSNEDGPRLRLVFDEVPADALEVWMRLRLSSSAARQFNEELQALFERWREHKSTRGATYLVHGACARVG